MTEINRDKTTLMERQLIRKETFDKYQDELIKMRDVKKGARYRRWLYYRLKKLSEEVFGTEELEYQSVQKFHRGIWIDVINTFKNDELKFIALIAYHYGSMDY
jgi:hypothetical protein